MAGQGAFYRTVCVAALIAATGVIASACEGPEQDGAGPTAAAPMDPVTRGQYLVSIGGCNDCHTPGALLGMPDFDHPLSGGDVSFFMPGLGYFYPPNLTPDEASGLGSWSDDQIVTALRTGMRPDGRILAPIMPWMGLSNLTDDDAYAIAAYLKSLPPVDHQVPPPTGADETPPGPYMGVEFPEAPDDATETP